MTQWWHDVSGVKAVAVQGTRTIMIYVGTTKNFYYVFSVFYGQFIRLPGLYRPPGGGGSNLPACALSCCKTSCAAPATACTGPKTDGTLAMCTATPAVTGTLCRDAATATCAATACTAATCATACAPGMAAAPFVC